MLESGFGPMPYTITVTEFSNKLEMFPTFVSLEDSALWEKPREKIFQRNYYDCLSTLLPILLCTHVNLSTGPIIHTTKNNGSISGSSNRILIDKTVDAPLIVNGRFIGPACENEQDRTILNYLRENHGKEMAIVSQHNIVFPLDENTRDIAGVIHHIPESPMQLNLTRWQDWFPTSPGFQ